MRPWPPAKVQHPLINGENLVALPSLNPTVSTVIAFDCAVPDEACARHLLRSPWLTTFRVPLYVWFPSPRPNLREICRETEERLQFLDWVLRKWEKAWDSGATGQEATTSCRIDIAKDPVIVQMWKSAQMQEI